MKNLAAFRKKLGQWYDSHGRALPWRGSPTLYRTVVSEFMCQQTRIDTAIPYFLRWMEVFPDFITLANAKEEKVLKLWEGLGYYQRARNLHRLAGEIAELKEIPTSAADWEKFPGVGRYTAAAITSIIFETPAACVDGNVVRVLARVNNIDKEFKNNSEAAGFFRKTADGLLDRKNPGRHNQAMMELGATICLKTRPQCSQCPVSSYCLARRAGNQDSLPRFRSRQITAANVNRIWAQIGDSLLLYQIPPNDTRLANLYELPPVDHILLNGCERTLIKQARRSISNQRITERIYSIDPGKDLRRKIDQNSKLRWISFDQLDKITLSGPHRRWIKEILDRDS